MADATLFMPIKQETGLTLETEAGAKNPVLFAVIRARSKYGRPIKLR